MESIKKPLTSFIALFILLASPLTANAWIILPIPTPQEVSPPSIEVVFSFNGIDIINGGEYFLPIAETKKTIFTYPGEIAGDAYVEIYKGELNNSKLVFTSLVDNSGILEAENSLTEIGKYFVVAYNFSPCWFFCFEPISVSSVQDWFETGKTIFAYNSPLNPWGIINFTISEQIQNNPPILLYSEEVGYASDTANEGSKGIHPNKGTADKTEMIFKIVYTDSDNDAPNEMNVFVGDGVSTTTFAMLPDISATAMLTDGDYTNGEQFTAISTFPKGKYQYRFEASDGTNTTRQPASTATSTTLTFQTGYSNIAFLPGIQASRLYDVTGVIWEPDNNTEALKIALNLDGTSQDTDIYVKEREIIDEIKSVSFPQPNIYESFIKNMNNFVDKDNVINEWSPIAYDWRLDFDDVVNNGYESDGKIYYSYATDTPYIIQELKRLQKTSANGKVTIVAHSTGGLIAKTLIDKLRAENDSLIVNEEIDKFIMVATPQLGTPKTIDSLLHGEETNIFKRRFLNQQTKRFLGQNMQSAYNLLPSEEYFQVVDTDTQPIITFNSDAEILQVFRNTYGDNITDIESMYEFLLAKEGRAKPEFYDTLNPEILNAELLSGATSTQKKLNDWVVPSGMEITQIAGWGLEKTIRGIEYNSIKTKVNCVAPLTGVCYGEIIDPRPLQTKDGDGTVVVPSAIAMSVDKFYLDLPKHNKGLTVNRDHADIFEVDSIFELIKEKVKNTFDSSKLPKYLYAEKPPVTNSFYRLALRSPVSINVYDSYGNHTGLAYDQNTDSYYPEEQIPNSYYMEFGEGKYVGLDTNQEYRIELNGQDTGTFTFEIEEVLGGEILNSTTYKNIPVTASTIAVLNLQNLDTAPEITIDIDGDGIADTKITGNAKEDILTSFKILRSIIKDTKMHHELKHKLIKELKKIEKEFKKGKTNKATKKLNKIIKKLEKEIKKNTKLEEKEEYHDEGDDEHEDDKDKHKNKHKKKKDKHDKKEHKEKYKHNKKKLHILTEDAQRLIFIVEQLRERML